MSLLNNAEISGDLTVSGTISGQITVSPKVKIESNKNVSPSNVEQVVVPSENYDALAQVTVGAARITPITISAGEAGNEGIMPSPEYVGFGPINVKPLQNKTVTPTAQQQTITADNYNDYLGLGVVTVEAASTLYDFVLSSNMQSQIPDYMFRDQVNMRSFKTNKNNAYSMGSQVFDGCTNLKRVEMPYLTGIGMDAFYGCNNITDYYFGYKSVGMPADASQVPSLRSNNQLRGNNFKIHVPADMETYYKEATYWSNYASRIVGDYVIS